MKRILVVLSLLVVAGIIAWLAVTRHLAQERANHLDRALMDAEARLMQVETELDALKTSASNAPPATAAPAQEPARFAATASGVTNVVRIEGTSSVHKWQVEGHLIGGSAEFGPGFPQASPGTVPASANVFIPVRSMKSVEDNGQPYSSAMDEIMYGKLLVEKYPRIVFHLSALGLKEPPKESAAPFLFEASGSLEVAGVTNPVTIPVTVSPQPNGKISVQGKFQTKMTDFKISPPAPSFAGGVITTGDEVDLSFTWWLNPIPSRAPAK